MKFMKIKFEGHGFEIFEWKFMKILKFDGHGFQSSLDIKNGKCSLYILKTIKDPDGNYQESHEIYINHGFKLSCELKNQKMLVISKSIKDRDGNYQES